MTKGWIAAAAIATLGVVAVPVAKAQFHGGSHGHARHEMGAMGFGGGMGPLGHLRQLREKLDLSDEQVAQIKQIAVDVHQQNSVYHTAMKEDFHQVAKVLIANPNDVDRAESLLEQNENARKQFRQNILKGVSRALNVLTPEQRSKLADIVAEHEQRMSGADEK